MKRRDLLKALFATPAIYLASKYGLPDGTKLDNSKLESKYNIFPGHYFPLTEVQFCSHGIGSLSR